MADVDFLTLEDIEKFFPDMPEKNPENRHINNSDFEPSVSEDDASSKSPTDISDDHD